MAAFVSYEGSPPLTISVTPCSSPPLRPESRDYKRSPLTASPIDLDSDKGMPSSPLATSSPFDAVRLQGKGTLRADLAYSSVSDTSSPASVGRSLSISAHPTAGVPRSLPVPPRRGAFSLRGTLMHAFVSYRVSTEGPTGNGLSGLLAQKIRSLSMHEEGLQIPRHGFGIWPKGVKAPFPFRPQEAKVSLPTQLCEAGASALARSEAYLPPRATPSSQLTPHHFAGTPLCRVQAQIDRRRVDQQHPQVFLDKDCLLDGQSWLSGLVAGLTTSMVFVPLLSWTEDDQGSLGELSMIKAGGFDRVVRLSTPPLDIAFSLAPSFSRAVHLPYGSGCWIDSYLELDSVRACNTPNHGDSLQRQRCHTLK